MEALADRKAVTPEQASVLRMLAWCRDFALLQLYEQVRDAPHLPYFVIPYHICTAPLPLPRVKLLHSCGLICVFLFPHTLSVLEQLCLSSSPFPSPSPCKNHPGTTPPTLLQVRYDEAALVSALKARCGSLRRPGLYVVHIAAEMAPIAKVRRCMYRQLGCEGWLFSVLRMKWSIGPHTVTLVYCFPHLYRMYCLPWPTAWPASATSIH